MTKPPKATKKSKPKFNLEDFPFYRGRGPQRVPKAKAVTRTHTYPAKPLSSDKNYEIWLDATCRVEYLPAKLPKRKKVRG